MTFRGLHWLLLCFAVLSTLAVVVWHPGDGDGFWGGVEGRFLDMRFALRGPLEAPASVAILAIDNTDLAALGQFPPPRGALAAAVEAVTNAGAAAVALDLLLVQRTEEDAALRAALERNGRAVLAVARDGPPDATDGLAEAVSRSGYGIVIGDPGVVPSNPMGPDPVLAQGAVLGHANIAPERDGALRRVPAGVSLNTPQGPVWVPGLALAAAALAEGHSPLILRFPTSGRSGSIDGPAGPVRLDRFGAIPIVWYGPERTIPTWPLRDAGTADLSGRVVFIGMTALGVGDRHPTPFASSFPGVEAQATLAANLLEGRHLRRDDTAWALDLALALVAVVLIFHAAALERPALAMLASATGVALTGAALHAAFVAGWWMDATTVSLVLALGIGTGALQRLLQHRRRSANLARYQSPLIAETLANESRPAFDGRSQEAVALFVDVAGYTARSEQAGPDGTAAFLRGFHAAVERAAIRHGGVVEQFAGDGAMIIFGLPQPGPNDAAAALGCIVALFDEMRGGANIRIRVGAHCGIVRAGVVGGARQRHVTVSGDVVNAASRLQEVAKEQQAGLAISDALLQQSGDPSGWTARLALRDLGPRDLRGRASALHVWTGSLPEEAQK